MNVKTDCETDGSLTALGCTLPPPPPASASTFVHCVRLKWWKDFNNHRLTIDSIYRIGSRWPVLSIDNSGPEIWGHNYVTCRCHSHSSAKQTGISPPGRRVDRWRVLWCCVATPCTSIAALFHKLITIQAALIREEWIMSAVVLNRKWPHWIKVKTLGH